ncbi:MAG: hypothetical protein NVSMB17_20010 [Candidatus Dormibacteria bacterium]
MPARVAALVSLTVLTLVASCGAVGRPQASTPAPPATASATPPGNTVPPPSAGSTPAPDANPIPVTRGYAVVTGGMTAGGGTYSTSLITADGTAAAVAQAQMRGGFSCGTGPALAVLPIPQVSTTNSRAYFLDGMTTLRYLAPNGSTGVAATLPGGPQVATVFAVSPDDKRIAVNVLDYTSLPLKQRLYVEDLAGGNRVEVYSTAAGAASSSSALWPVGWRTGRLVLAYQPVTCSQGSGRGVGQPTSFHVSDATTGQRLATIGADAGNCQMVDPEPSGLACTPGDNSVQLFDWQGAGGHRLSCPDGLINLSPDGAKILCGLFSTTKAVVVGDDGSRVELPGPPGYGGFIDSDHVYLGGGSQQDPARVITLSSGATKSVSVVGIFRARLPGTLDPGRGT